MMKPGSEISTVVAAVSPSVNTGYFEYLGVNDDDLLAEAYRVRYQVFCVERGYLNGDQYPDLQESDEFDFKSVHVLARHRSGIAAGTARLVLHSQLGFPCQARCAFFDTYAYLRDPASQGLETYSEVSRLAVSKLFRRRVGDSLYGGDPRSGQNPHFTASRQRTQCLRQPAGPEIIIGVLKYLYHETKRLGITHWLIAVDRGLDVTIRRMGWPFVQVGPEVDYYGPVRPYLAEVVAADRVLAIKNPALFAFLNHGLDQEIGVACS